MERKTKLFSIDGITIQFSIIGEGIPVLVMHGGHSNCYEEFGYQALLENGFSVITPSRAGYGKTSKEIGSSLAVASHYYLKLLDHLEIEKVHLLAVSAGGPSGIYFAAEYPERVESLILESAVTKQWHTSKDKEYKAAQVLFRPFLEKFTWKLVSSMSNRFPNYIFKQFVPSFSTLAYDEVMARMDKEAIEEFKKMNNRQRSGDGFLLDLIRNNEISLKDLQGIVCPTLIMHSKNDSAVPLDHAYYAHENISGSQLFMLDSWGHLIWIGKDSKEYDNKLLEFINK